MFDDEEHVPHLLSQCSYNNSAWYFKISSRRMRSKEVQIIPWVLADSNYVRCPSQRLDPQKTVFVGALHGMLNAEGLAHIFNDLFGGVVYAGELVVLVRSLDVINSKKKLACQVSTLTNTNILLEVVVSPSAAPGPT